MRICVYERGLLLSTMQSETETCMRMKLKPKEETRRIAHIIRAWPSEFSAPTPIRDKSAHERKEILVQDPITATTMDRKFFL